MTFDSDVFPEQIQPCILVLVQKGSCFHLHDVKVMFGQEMFLIWYSHRTGCEAQKGGDLTQNYDKSPYTNRNVKRAK